MSASHDQPKSLNDPETEIPRKVAASNFGFFSLVSLVVASMIGSGVFTTSGFALGDLGDSRLVLAVWCIGGIVALCGAIGYGALAARLPGSGGEYLYLSKSMHPAVGFLAGWISLVAGFTVPMSLAAKTFATYMLSGWSSGPWQVEIVATVAICIAAIANSISSKTGAWMQNSMVTGKLLLLLLFLGWAFMAPADRWHANTLPMEKWPVEGYMVILAMAGSLVWVSLSYTGFNAAIYVAGEAPMAERWVPKSMIWATLVVTVFYVALNYVFLHGAAAEKISGQPEVALIAARELQGSGLESLIRFIVCLATLTSVWSIAIAGPRVYSQMAVDRLMPAWLMTRGGEPRLAIWVQAILAVVVVWFASLRDMLGYLGMTLSMCAALTVACVLLPNRGAEAERNQASAIAKVASAIYVLTTIGLIVLAASNRRYEMFAMVATVVVGIILMLVWKQVYPSEGISSTDSKRA